MKHEFSDRLRFCRRQRGLTQEQLAEAMGVSVAAVSKWELGDSLSYRYHLKRIAL